MSEQGAYAGGVPGVAIGLSVFFPAYHEEDNIGKVTEQAVSVLEELGCDYEVIIVNDGSLDRTGEVADELAWRYPGVRVIHHERNRGYGAALKTGFTSAKHEYIFYTDGDNQFDVRELKKFIVMLQFSDLVIGFRNRKRYSFYQKVTSFTYNLVLQTLFDLPYRDVDCAFKLIPKSLIDRVSLDSVNAFIDAELLIKAQQLDYSLTEVGVSHYPRETGSSRGATVDVVLGTMREMARFYMQVRAEDQKRTPI